MWLQLQRQCCFWPSNALAAHFAMQPHQIRICCTRKTKSLPYKKIFLHSFVVSIWATMLYHCICIAVYRRYPTFCLSPFVQLAVCRTITKQLTKQSLSRRLLAETSVWRPAPSCDESILAISESIGKSVCANHAQGQLTCCTIIFRKITKSGNVTIKHNAPRDPPNASLGLPLTLERYFWKKFIYHLYYIE